MQRLVDFPVTTVPLPTFSLIYIGFRHTDKMMSYRILNRMVELLRKRFVTLITENLQERKQYIQERMAETEDRIETHKEELEQFRKEYGVFDVDRQAAMQADLLADKMAEVLKLELELRSAQRYFGSDSSRVRLLKDQIDTIKRFISELQTERIGGLIPLDQVPGLEERYTIISQNLQIQLTIYERLRTEYEKIRLSEAGSLENIQIVEKAEIPEGPVFPNRLLILLTIGFMAFFEAFVWALLKEYLERVKKRPGEQEKVRDIKTMLKRL